MASEDSGTKWLYGLGGAALGGLVTYLWDHHGGDEDEDRPPILVKDGSLVFASGDPEGEKEEQAGKSWKKDGDEWQPDHPKGKATKWFVVELTSSSGCPETSLTKKIEITYAGKVFTVEAKPEFGGKGKKVPTIKGPGLSPDGGADSTVLIHDKGSTVKMTKVEFKTRDGDVTCTSVDSMRIWQF